MLFRSERYGLHLGVLLGSSSLSAGLGGEGEGWGSLVAVGFGGSGDGAGSGSILAISKDSGSSPALSSAKGMASPCSLVLVTRASSSFSGRSSPA